MADVSKGGAGWGVRQKKKKTHRWTERQTDCFAGKRAARSGFKPQPEAYTCVAQPLVLKSAKGVQRRVSRDHIGCCNFTEVLKRKPNSRLNTVSCRTVLQNLDCVQDDI